MQVQQEAASSHNAQRQKALLQTTDQLSSNKDTTETAPQRQHCSSAGPRAIFVATFSVKLYFKGALCNF